MRDKLKFTVDTYYLTDSYSEPSPFIELGELQEEIARIELAEPEFRGVCRGVTGFEGRPRVNVLFVDGIRRNLASGTVRVGECYGRWMLTLLAVGGSLIINPSDRFNCRTFISGYSFSPEPLLSLTLLYEKVGETYELELKEYLKPLLQNMRVRELRMRRIVNWEGINERLNEELAQLESEYCTTVFEVGTVSDRPTILVSDGTLRKFRLYRSSPALHRVPKVGVVKSHRARYYPESFPLYNLEFAKRTPTFKVNLRGLPILTFYLKLSRVEGFGGIIRVEYFEDELDIFRSVLEVKSIGEISDTLASLLLELSGVLEYDLPHLPRWPQNTIPVRVLEKYLRHLLPSPKLLKRLIMLSMEH